MSAAVIALIWEEQRRLILFACGALLLALVLGAYQRTVQTPEVDGQREELLQLQERLRSRTVDLHQVETPYRSYLIAREEVKRFRDLLPESSHFPDFLDRLDAVARRSNLHLASVSYKPQELEHAGVLAYNLTFTLAGNYRDIRAFIAAIEEEKGLMTLLNVGLSSQPEGGEVEFRVGMVAYFRMAGHD